MGTGLVDTTFSSLSSVSKSLYLSVCRTWFIADMSQFTVADTPSGSRALVSLLHSVCGGKVKEEETWDLSISLHFLYLSALWEARAGAFLPTSCAC